MTEPTPDETIEHSPTGLGRTLAANLSRPGERGGVATRVVTVALAVLFAGAVTVGAGALATHKSGPNRAAGAARPPVVVPTTASPSRTPARRPRHAPPPGRPRRTPTPTPHRSSSAASRAIVNYESGRCADAGHGTALEIWDCDGGAHQRWTFATGHTVRSLGRCMTAGGSADGAPIRLAACTGAASQQFTLNTSADLVNLGSDQCVDVTDQKTTDGTPLQLWQCAGTSNQKWHT